MPNFNWDEHLLCWETRIQSGTSQKEIHGGCTPINVIGTCCIGSIIHDTDVHINLFNLFKCVTRAFHATRRSNADPHGAENEGIIACQAIDLSHSEVHGSTLRYSTELRYAIIG